MSPIGWRHWLGAIRVAWRLAKSGDWDVLLAEGPCHEGPVLRFLDRRRRGRIVLDSHNGTVRVAPGGDLPGRKRRILAAELRTWDGFIVLTDMAEVAVRRIRGPSADVARWTPTVVGGDPFGAPVADPRGPGVAVMNGGAGYRLWYKGLDRVAEISRIGAAEGFERVTLYGQWPAEVQKPFEEDIVFAGVGEVANVLRGAGYLVHPSRADAFPVAVIEAMLAGVPPVVGTAGSAELVAEVEPRLHAELVTDAADAVRWLRGLDAGAYGRLSHALRARALRYVEESGSDAALTGARELVARVGDGRRA
jgi:glycosyltransferase involved in cell wall biosynthesis